MNPMRTSKPRLLQMADASADIVGVEATLATAKKCLSGPLFHFRVSSLGNKILCEQVAKAQSQRSNQVFERRWRQT